MKHPIKLKGLATKMREKGFSLEEISQKLGIAKSTASLWSRNIDLSKNAFLRIEKRKSLGKAKSLAIRKNKSDQSKKVYLSWCLSVLEKVQINKPLAQILCAVLYWAEGAKFSDNRLEFTNSDPTMIKTYLKLLRKGFIIDSNKFRANIHIHAYHNDKEQKRFWSKITKIPLSQFYKSYQKANTQKRIRKNYQGCVRICYYSADTARRVKALYQNLINYI